MTEQVDAQTALERIRNTIMSPGWTEHMVPTLASKMDAAKDQLVAMPQQRTPPFDKWSEDRIAGYVLEKENNSQ